MTSPSALRPPDAPAPTCGTCKFAKDADAQHIACFGVPPTPVLMGQRPGQFGGVQVHFESIHPICKREEPACSLYKLKIDISGLDVKGNG